MNIYLGIDIGTSGTKTLAVNEDGAILASATAEYPLDSPHPGWSEQDPAHWWHATCATVKEVVSESGAKPADVKGIGLSGQMHGSVFLDKNGEVIRPALLWNDQRTARQCEEITEKAGGREALIGMVANPALTGFTAPKILWLREHEPQNYERMTQCLLPKDYVRFKLTGQFATEVSDASGTLLLDVVNRRWSGELISKLGLDAAHYPKVYESQEVSGGLTAVVAADLGLKEGTLVVGGGGDQAAGAVGNGIVSAGVVSATMGTSGVVFAHSDKVQVDPQGRLHTFCHAVPGKWHVMGVVLSAAGSLQWYRNQLCQVQQEAAKKQGVDVYELITKDAEAAPAGSEGLFFLPYLTGERTPHADPDARGAWVGLSLRHDRRHFARSVIEGATYAMRDCMEITRGMNIPVSQVRVSGGGAKSVFWRRVQAGMYGLPVCRINAEEGPAYGVALLAMAGTGAYGSVQEACEATIRVVEETAPDAAEQATYERGHAIYQSLYASLKDDYRRIAEFVAG